MFPLRGFYCFSFKANKGISSAWGNLLHTAETPTLLSCESKGPVTFNNRGGCRVEGLAARAHKPLSAQPPTASIVTDTQALNWKLEDTEEGRVVNGKGWRN